MGNTMYVSVPTSDGSWYSLKVRPNGQIVGVISGSFVTKSAADIHAKRDVGSPK
jgi:hypothetical protein